MHAKVFSDANRGYIHIEPVSKETEHLSLETPYVPIEIVGGLKCDEELLKNLELVDVKSPDTCYETCEITFREISRVDKPEYFHYAFGLAYVAGPAVLRFRVQYNGETYERYIKPGSMYIFFPFKPIRRDNAVNVRWTFLRPPEGLYTFTLLKGYINRDTGHFCVTSKDCPSITMRVEKPAPPPPSVPIEAIILGAVALGAIAVGAYILSRQK